MAIPIAPSVTDIVTQALKRSGRTSPSAIQITEATDHALQEVKADIMLIAPTHPLLEVTATTVTTRGQQRYAIPDDLNEFISITLMDASDNYRGTIIGGAVSSVILSGTYTDDDLTGKYILITAGSGVEEYRQVLSYAVGTSTAVVDIPWTTIPTPGSTYLIVTNYASLWPQNITVDFERIDQQTIIGTPNAATLFNQEYVLYPVPDKSTYGLKTRYWCDLSKLDETDSLFIQLLREWRSLWIQGVAVKCMQRFDDERYSGELNVYKLMLDLLTHQTCRVTQMRQYDV